MRSIGAFFRNLGRGEMPLGRRLGLIARSYWRRIAMRQACCGLPASPGC